LRGVLRFGNMMIKKFIRSIRRVEVGTVLTVIEARRRLSDLVKRAAYGGEHVLIGVRGKPEAALVPLADLERLRALELEHDTRLLEEAVRSSRGTVHLDAALRAWGLVPEASWKRRRAGRRKRT
jgi:prevent-host-death family protein